MKSQGNAQATQIVLTDTMPLSLTNHAITSTITITDTGTTPPYVWQVADLAAGASGTITLTAVVSPNLTSGFVFTNTALITSANDPVPTNNHAQEVITVSVPSLYLRSTNYETDEHTQSALIVVRVNPSNPYANLAVDYATYDGTATAFSDYTPISGTLTITDRNSTATLSVPIIDDKIEEPDETLFLKLSNPRDSRHTVHHHPYHYRERRANPNDVLYEILPSIPCCVPCYALSTATILADYPPGACNCTKLVLTCCWNGAT